MGHMWSVLENTGQKLFDKLIKLLQLNQNALVVIVSYFLRKPHCCLPVPLQLSIGNVTTCYSANSLAHSGSDNGITLHPQNSMLTSLFSFLLRILGLQKLYRLYLSVNGNIYNKTCKGSDVARMLIETDDDSDLSSLSESEVDVSPKEPLTELNWMLNHMQ